MFPRLPGIPDLATPDWGDAVPLKPGEVPVFHACGVTACEVLKNAKLPLAVTHAPGYMFVGDLTTEAMKGWEVPGMEQALRRLGQPLAGAGPPPGGGAKNHGTVGNGDHDQQPGTTIVSYTLPGGRLRSISRKELDEGYDTGGHNADILDVFKTKASARSEAEYMRLLPPSASHENFLDLRYGDRPEERMDFLVATVESTAPSSSLPARPATVLWIHGGGWQIPNPKEVNAWVGAGLRTRNVNFALLEYSAHSPANLPIATQCQQAIRAVQWLSAKLKTGSLPGDPELLFVGGHSAGGHLAAVCGLHAESSRLLAGVLSVAGVGDLAPIQKSYLDRPWGGGQRGGRGVRLTDGEVLAFSPARMIRAIGREKGVVPVVPPLITAAGSAEIPELVRQTREELAEVWREIGGFCQELEIPGYRHFDISTSRRSSPRYSACSSTGKARCWNQNL